MRFPTDFNETVTYAYLLLTQDFVCHYNTTLERKCSLRRIENTNVTNRIIGNNKKLTQLSAIIATIFVEGVKKNRNFAITGYDMTRVIGDMRMNFSHQQIYRELKALRFLTSVEIPQDGKPNKKVYSVNIDLDEYINTIHNYIDFDPRKTHTKNMYAFSHLPNLVCAYQAHIKFIDSKEEEHNKRMKRIAKGEEMNFTVPDLHDLNNQLDSLLSEKLLQKISRLAASAERVKLPKDIAYAIELLTDDHPILFS